MSLNEKRNIMTDYRKDFLNFEDKVWLNSASEGPLSIVSGEALKESIVWKSLSYILTNDKFIEVQTDLKQSIDHLLNINPKEERKEASNGER